MVTPVAQAGSFPQSQGFPQLQAREGTALLRGAFRRHICLQEDLVRFHRRFGRHRLAHQHVVERIKHHTGGTNLSMKGPASTKKHVQSAKSIKTENEIDDSALRRCSPVESCSTEALLRHHLQQIVLTLLPALPPHPVC